jgi:hypothetical protein
MSRICCVHGTGEQLPVFRSVCVDGHMIEWLYVSRWGDIGGMIPGVQAQFGNGRLAYVCVCWNRIPCSSFDTFCPDSELSAVKRLSWHCGCTIKPWGIHATGIGALFVDSVVPMLAVGTFGVSTSPHAQHAFKGIDVPSGSSSAILQISSPMHLFPLDLVRSLLNVVSVTSSALVRHNASRSLDRMRLLRQVQNSVDVLYEALLIWALRVDGR